MAQIVKTQPLDDVATGLQTGTVGEPSFAASGQRMMMAGNWYASRSTNGGETWSLMDPFTSFPRTSGDFCCDQVVHYSKSRRMWVWLLQYQKQSTGANIFRIATSPTGAPGTWKWWDITATDVDAGWSATWFDYPDMAESDDHLWISFNMFDRSDRWTRAVVFRFPLDDLDGRETLTHETWDTTSVGSLRFTQGAEDTMWWAAHDGTQRGIRLMAWGDTGSSVSSWTVPIRPWRAGPYQSLGPGGADWLARVDGRITAAWRTEGTLGFGWTASPGPERPHPHIRVAQISEDSLTLLNEPDLWSANGAYAYPAACPNRRGDVGMTAFFGGPSHPAHVVANLDKSAGEWKVAQAAQSTHGPSQGKWGDYVACRPDPRRKTYWQASGFTLQGGIDRRNVEPEVVTFKP